MPHFDRLWVVYKHSNAKRVKSKSYRCIELSLSTETTTDIETAAHVAHVYCESGRILYALIVYDWAVRRWPIPKLPHLCNGFGILLPPNLVIHTRRTQKPTEKISNENEHKSAFYAWDNSIIFSHRFIYVYDLSWILWKTFFVFEHCHKLYRFPDWLAVSTIIKLRNHLANDLSSIRCQRELIIFGIAIRKRSRSTHRMMDVECLIW